MAFIGLVDEGQVAPEVRRLFDQVKKERGLLPNFLRAIGRDADVLRGDTSLSTAAMKEGALPAKLKEQIGVVVSGINASSYCVAFHMENLRVLGIETSLGKKLATRYETATSDAKTQALFRFCDKLTRQQDELAAEDVDVLRAAGWSDVEIFEAVIVVAYFNFANRISLGLGLVADY